MALTDENRNAAKKYFSGPDNESITCYKTLRKRALTNLDKFETELEKCYLYSGKVKNLQILKDVKDMLEDSPKVFIDSIEISLDTDYDY